jgi:hypothetical protein
MQSTSSREEVLKFGGVEVQWSCGSRILLPLSRMFFVPLARSFRIPAPNDREFASYFFKLFLTSRASRIGSKSLSSAGR